MDNVFIKRLIHRVLLGSLLFGMFFGAGNLIFPISVGQAAGSSFSMSSVGFIISGVGLASLAAIYCAKSNKSTLESMLKPYGKIYSRLFTILLLLTIGPMFALPRTATVPYEIGIRSLLPDVNHTVGLFIYSLVFFAMALVLSLYPTKLKELIGKYINPIFLFCLLVFFVTFFIKTMGPVQSIVIDPSYIDNPFLVGFELGYQTMDVLAALAFSFVVINTNDFEDSNEKRNAKVYDVMFAGVFAGILMAIIYYILTYIGASSRNIFDIAPNGGIALGYIFNHYFGTLGTLFLSITITIACLKTAIGLIVACSTYFEPIIEGINYRQLVFVFSILGFMISNIGLSAIITYSVPVLNFLYPLAIMHVLVGLVFKETDSKLVNYSVLGFTLIASVIEFVMSFPSLVKSSLIIESIVHVYTTKIPFSSIGIEWINFTLVGLLVGYTLHFIMNRRTVSLAEGVKS